MINIEALCQAAKSASRSLALVNTEKKNQALKKLADWLPNHSSEVQEANQLDVREAEENGLSTAMIDRLTLTDKRIQGMAFDLNNVINLPDPVGEVFEKKELENGLAVQKIRVPLGVLVVIYESRPNVTIDVAALALKSGNAVILRGGSETIHSNRILVEGVREALSAANIDPAVVQFIDDPDRALVNKLLKMHKYVDMLIPRGGAGLHTFCRENSTIPVITGGIGICHLFVDESADLERSLAVVRNAKIQRPSVCNSLDTLLVHKSIAASFIPMLIAKLKKDGVRFYVDEITMKGLGLNTDAFVQTADEDDFDREWLSLKLGIKTVTELDEAIAHIAAHSTGHSDGILTEDEANARKFTETVDSAAVYVNASTRFTDGAQLGLGAEVAISTQRLHARGPMALRELTTFKWVISGDYHIRK